MNSTSPRSVSAIVLALLAFGLIALALGGYLTPVTRIVLSPFITAQTWLSTRYQALSEFISSPSDTTHLRQRNTELEAENSQLQAQIIELQKQLSEVPVLTALLNFETTHPESKYMAATVIGYDTNPFLRYVLINRGSDAGIRRGMPVVGAKGLIGRVAAVGPNGARVQLITDPTSRVNVRLEKSGVEAILAGQLTGEINLENITQDVSLEVGDLVLTSGLGGEYPPNLLIGQVTGVKKRDYDLFQTATVQPVEDFSKLNIVLVISNFTPTDIQPLLP